MKSILLLLILCSLTGYCQRKDYSVKEFYKNLARRKEVPFIIIIKIHDVEGFRYCPISNPYLYEKYGEIFNNEFNDYTDFITSVLNDSIKIQSNKFVTNSDCKIERNNEVRLEYEKYDVVHIINKYFEKASNGIKLNMLGLNYTDELLLIMFENQYFILIDDYSGNYKFLTKYELPR